MMTQNQADAYIGHLILAVCIVYVTWVCFSNIQDIKQRLDVIERQMKR